MLLLACGGEETPLTGVAAERAIAANPPQSASAPDQQAKRFEHFRSQLQSRLDRHSGDLERHRQGPEVTRVPLQRRFGSAVVARRNANGRLEFGCFDDADRSARFLTNSATAGEPRR